MNVVDSSGWLEYFAGSTNASFFAPVVKETDTLAQRGEGSALQAIGIMSLGIISDLTREIAVNAATISPEINMAMADSIILATARTYDATLWTQDADFEGKGGVQFIEKKG